MDFFASHMISLVLSWVSCVFILIALLGALVLTLLDKAEGIPRVVTIWLTVCVIVLSPLRYTILQSAMMTAYPYQSVSAFLATLLMGLYIPIVFGILNVAAFGPPLIGFLFTGMREPVTKARLFLLCALTPVGCLLGSYLFTIVLPYAAMSIHWLKMKDVMRSTNGPAFYFHAFAVDVWNPMDLFVDEGRHNQSLREHVYTVYFSEKQKASYRRAVTVHHFSQSLSYALDAFAAHEEGTTWKKDSLLGTVDEKAVDEVVRLEKLALAESGLVSIEELNGMFPDLGNHYRDNFVAGLEAAVEGYETGKNLSSMRGSLLLRQWATWYGANWENIHGARQ